MLEHCKDMEEEEQEEEDEEEKEEEEEIEERNEGRVEENVVKLKRWNALFMQGWVFKAFYQFLAILS